MWDKFAEWAIETEVRYRCVISAIYLISGGLIAICLYYYLTLIGLS